MVCDKVIYIYGRHVILEDNMVDMEYFWVFILIV